MSLLLRDPDVQPDGGAPEPEAPAAPACPTCGQPLEPGQDWCLSCGQAQPGRLASLPGRRAVATVAVLTAVLVGAAVAAAYAALQDDGPAPATPTQLAQAPVPAPAPSSAVPAAPAPSSAVPAAPTPSATTPPNATAPTTSTTPKAPSTPPTPVTPAPAPSTGSTGSVGPTGSTGTGTTGTGTTGTGTGTGTSTTANPRTSAPTTPAAPAEPQPVKLADDAAALYDPYTRNQVATDPPPDVQRLLDGNPDTSFPITVVPGSQQIAVGLTVALPKLQGIKEIDLLTKTPGFRIEIYATDSRELPPNVLDTRWAHIKDVSKVGADDDGHELVKLGSGTSKYRHLLLWFTTPPTEGTTIRIAGLKLLD